MSRFALAFWLGHVHILLCVQAHYIQIDHEEFRASGFPHPHFPPPPMTPLDHLPQVLAVKELTPAEVMVDLTNDLTHRLLHYHSILNRNNFAFSPTALVSVLVALYEGSSSNSANELRNVLQLPNNRDVIRVGYRDIHRRLRTYFFGSDNPLKGLSLNKNNVTVLKDFETVLMFYGYDLSVDMVSSTPANLTADAEMVSTTTPSGNTTTEEVEAETTTTSSTVKDEETTTEMPTTTTTEEAPTTTTTEEPTTTTEAPPETETTTEAPAESSGEETAEPAGEDEAAELVSAFVAEEDSEPLLRIQKARVSRLPTSKLQAPLKHSNPITPKPIYLPSARTATMPMMARQVAERKPPNTRQIISISAPPSANGSYARKSKMSRHKRHALPYRELDSNLFLTLFNPQAPHPAPHPFQYPPTGAFAPIHNDFEPHFISEAAESKSNYNTDVISHVFYLGSHQIVHTTFKVYNAVLYFKYFEHLKMSVLELELDTPEYNLMILLPDYHTDIVAAAASLKLGPTLRLMRNQLKPRWVQAIIPDFKLHGTMFLTNDLQNVSSFKMNLHLFVINLCFGCLTDGHVSCLLRAISAASHFYFLLVRFSLQL
ncbi:blast:Serpin B8 [Drosophila guanche]|uniref:Blast:Serpin B8 n=1 Tax=Drosophila guanche TaxID=7266 RepID=A0A3B0JDP3_DROGU|nr:blast:Serpin B8 [Drosophila guanche]